MAVEISVGVVSWINRKKLPDINAPSIIGLTDESKWIPKVIVGLIATANSAPPDTISDFPDFEKKHDYRAIQFGKFSVEPGTSGLSGFKVLDAFHGAGPTPPFSLGRFPSGIVESDARNSFSAAGEYSKISLVATQGRHTNSAITSKPVGDVLVNGLVKFRAGSHTDELGKKMGCPYHVPWVWSEMLLTYSDGKFQLTGRGSIFPTHTWYVNGKKVAEVSQVADSFLPFPTGGEIDTKSINLLRVLEKGRSAKEPQASADDEVGKKGAVDQHAYTVGGGSEITHSFSAAWRSAAG